MKRENTVEMTSEKGSNELVMESIKKLLQQARKKSREADEALRTVYAILEDNYVDLDVDTGAENTDTLEEAINCFVQYGEYGLTNVLKEIRQQLDDE